MSKSLKIILFSLLGLIVILIALKASGAIGSKQKGVKVATEFSSKSKIVETVSASGKIQPEVEVKLSPEVSGEIISLPVKEGQKVDKGQLLVKINPDIYESAVNRATAAVNSAKSSLSSAKARLIEAEQNYKRNKIVHEKGAISDAEFDGITANYEVAKLNVESAEFSLSSARASYNEARDNLSRTTIVAPMSGTISMLNVEAGERVVGTAQMAGTELLRVADLAVMEVVVEVNENDIIKVALGDTADIDVDAYLDQEFKGIVTEIANSANTQGVSADQITNFEVKIRILEESYKDLLAEGKEHISPFRPGMTATVEIKTESKTDIITVPIEAVTTRTDTASSRSFRSKREKKDSDDEAVEEEKETKKKKKKDDDEEDEELECVFVYNKEKKIAELVVVKTGIQDDKNIEILEGISDSTEVIVSPYSAVAKTLKNKSEVTKTSKSSVFDE